MSLLLALTLVFVATRASSGGVIGSATDNGDGTFSYSYVVDNSAGTFDIVGWSLGMALNPAQVDWDQNDLSVGGSVLVPTIDWIAAPGIPTAGKSSAQDFFSLSLAGDIDLGNSLGGFGFTSHRAPLNASYVEFGEAGEALTGITIGPAPQATIPDGGFTALLLLGCAICLGLFNKCPIMPGSKLPRSIAITES